jgi:predicted metal-dependent HD superfamily phosphohydrolase
MEQTVAAALAPRYREAHRAYHTLAHIRQVLATVSDLVAAGEPVADLTAVRLAAWFHDAIYVPGARDNERASAELAVRTLGPLGLDPARLSAIAALILDTADHVPRSPDARVLIDADLAILAAGPLSYDAYAAAVRAEYAAVTDEAWCAGRAAFLGGLLARPALFVTPTMRARAEGAARRNLAAERDRLLTMGA